MSSHRRLTGFDAVHQFCWVQSSDPSLVADNEVLAYQGWLDTDTDTLYVRNSTNTAWLTVGGATLDAALPITVNLEFTNGGAALAANQKMGFVIDDDVTLDEVSAFGTKDESGSVVVDFWADDYANGPPTVADTIVGGTKLTLSGAKTGQDATLTSWTTSFSGKKLWVLNLDSVSTFTQLTVSLRFTRVP